ncbi:hypothetical protein JX266_013914 [Neoarthrinium moseri]|nr:hypothetical protein JX266_013914 [Neoarthrinium moseri]
MGTNLAESRRELAQGMIESGGFTNAIIADAVGCSKRSIQKMRANLRCFEAIRAPGNAVGRPRSITPPMLSALREALLERPYMFQDEMVEFLADEFDAQVTTMSKTWFHRGKRYQILHAYTQDGVIFAKIYDGTTDSAVFETFIRDLLPCCGRWPEPKSVLVMDNAPFHLPDMIEQICREAGVKVLFLPPYSPDLNPVEEFFAELKAFIKRNWSSNIDHTPEGFVAFLQWC